MKFLTERYKRPEYEETGISNVVKEILNLKTLINTFDNKCIVDERPYDKKEDVGAIQGTGGGKYIMMQTLRMPAPQKTKEVYETDEDGLKLWRNHIASSIHELITSITLLCATYSKRTHDIGKYNKKTGEKCKAQLLTVAEKLDEAHKRVRELKLTPKGDTNDWVMNVLEEVLGTMNVKVEKPIKGETDIIYKELQQVRDDARKLVDERKLAARGAGALRLN